MKIIEKIFNAETAEETIIERDETSEEKESRLRRLEELAIAEAELKERIELRLAVIKKLGISEEEVRLLLS